VLPVYFFKQAHVYLQANSNKRRHSCLNGEFKYVEQSSGSHPGNIFSQFHGE